MNNHLIKQDSKSFWSPWPRDYVIESLWASLSSFELFMLLWESHWVSLSHFESLWVTLSLFESLWVALSGFESLWLSNANVLIMCKFTWIWSEYIVDMMCSLMWIWSECIVDIMFTNDLSRIEAVESLYSDCM